MKISFLIRSLDRGGAQRQLVLLAGGLRARGHEVSVVTFYPGGDFASRLNEAGVALYSLDKMGRWDLARLLFRLLSYMRAERPDVLYALMPTSNVIAALVGRIVPGLRVVWGVRSAGMKLDAFDFWSRVPYAVQNLLVGWPDLVICNSQAACRQMRRAGVAEDRLAQVSNGFDVMRFCGDSVAGAGMRAVWGIAPGAPVIGCAARLDPMKDHVGFLAAAARLAERHPTVRFVCVGGGDEDRRARLAARAVDLGLGGRLVWAGETADMPAAYNAMTVLALPSIAESFSNVVGEALACGVPVVATDVGDLAAIVGDCGLVVPPGDVDALAAAMGDMLDRSPQALAAMGSRGAARIRAQFGVDRLAGETEALLAQFAARGR